MALRCLNERGILMKALSVRAPWWWAILHGKPIENRDWYTNFRGPVLLHASKFWKDVDVLGDWNDVLDMAEDDGIDFPSDWPKEEMQEKSGCLVGKVTIVDCVRSHPSSFFVGEWGFVLRDPVIFENPIPFKGALGFFNVPDELLVG